MESRSCFIWRDQHDSEVFHLGVRLFDTHQYCCWCSIPEDGLEDIFGSEFKKWAKENVSTAPVPVVCTVTSRG